MIKNLLDSDEPAADRPTDPDEVRPTKGKFLSVLDVSDLNAAADEIPAGDVTPQPPTAAAVEPLAEPEKAEAIIDDPALRPVEQFVEHIEPPQTQAEAQKDTPSTRLPYTPPTTAESIRMSGLAYSAGLVLFASIAFMAVLGWLVDLLLGSTPWGIVVGMLLGSIIGFVQFFRINSEILDAMRPRSKKPDESMFPTAERQVPDPHDESTPK